MRLADLSLPPDRCFRITRQRYADLTGEGARLVGGRWNSAGRPAVYLAEAPSLAILETVVHLDLDRETLPPDYVLIEVDFQGLTEEADWLEEGPNVPPSDQDCRSLGDSFLASGKALALRVPSVIAPMSRNLIVNPAHPLAAKAHIHAVTPFAFDRRLLE
jgi:RES domain-containing protein